MLKLKKAKLLEADESKSEDDEWGSRAAAVPMAAEQYGATAVPMAAEQGDFAVLTEYQKMLLDCTHGPSRERGLGRLDRHKTSPEAALRDRRPGKFKSA